MARKPKVSESCIQDWTEKKDLILQSSSQWQAFQEQKQAFQK